VPSESEANFLSPEPLDPPIDPLKLAPLVEATIADYAQASLLLRLPGAIPIPAFDRSLPLPTTSWVDRRAGSFTSLIHHTLAHPPARVIDVPLIVRPLTSQVYEPATRDSLLHRMDVNPNHRDAHILLVSFGGQHIRRPASRPPSRSNTPSPTTERTSRALPPSLSAIDDEDQLLPPGWIAVVCGLAAATATDEELPERFYRVASDAYIPDLTAIADVVLGKLVRAVSVTLERRSRWRAGIRNMLRNARDVDALHLWCARFQPVYEGPTSCEQSRDRCS
jgi:L-arabinokinase